MSRVDPRAFGVRIVWSALIWIILTGGSTEGLLMAAVIVLLSAYVSVRNVLAELFQLPTAHLVRFIGLFLVLSFRGGLDVALRASQRTLDLAPGFVSFTTILPPGSARTFFVSVLGLLPGTLTARIDGDQLKIHVLDTRSDASQPLKLLETRIDEMFRHARRAR